jgi:hypothetical protein
VGPIYAEMPDCVSAEGGTEPLKHGAIKLCLGRLDYRVKMVVKQRCMRMPPFPCWSLQLTTAARIPSLRLKARRIRQPAAGNSTTLVRQGRQETSRFGSARMKSKLAIAALAILTGAFAAAKFFAEATNPPYLAKFWNRI